MSFCGRWFIGLGLFLFINGLAGFLSNPSGAKKALISEVTFGFLCAVGCADGAGTGLGSDGSRVHGISGGGVYLAGSGGMVYSARQPKLFAATLITLMLAGALISIGVLVKNRPGGESLPLF